MNSLRNTNSVFNGAGLGIRLTLYLDAGVELSLSRAGCYGTVAPSGPPDGLRPIRRSGDRLPLYVVLQCSVARDLDFGYI